MKKWECTVCGYIHEGETPPDECPVCSADKSMFVELVEEAAEKQAPTLGPQQSQNIHSQPGNKQLPGLLSSLITERHLHPISAHSPNGIVPMAVIFLVLALMAKQPLFFDFAYYSFIFVLLAMPAVIFTGYTMWKERYGGAKTSLFQIKIAAAATTTLLLLILVIWRMLRPALVEAGASGRGLYLFLSLVLLAVVGIAGHLGGKLVFGARK